MKDVVVAGGTTGLGRAIALHYLRQGARVTVIGSTPARGEQFLSEAGEARARAGFIRADLLSVAENRRVIEEVQARHDSLDALVLTAMTPFLKRVETVDGFEGTFVLYYLSRYLLSHGLTDLLERGNDPIIVSLGATGFTKSGVQWDDLQLTRRYSPARAILQGGRANDLLGVGYLQDHPDGRTRFMLDHPGYTNSGTNRMPQPLRTGLNLLAKVFAKSPEENAKRIIAVMDDQPERRFIPWDRDKPVDPDLSSFDPDNARRLSGLTRTLLA
ncbi:SDR family NAD(P)-dependent oxidoreductase [Kribbella deserti]|uniref:SDR family NAD(P)-dependent oxidoreductase n=1 Tax=Kribbella deserti TaxID=1926257 RepID=A0ABV6QUU0_9ACTN